MNEKNLDHMVRPDTIPFQTILQKGKARAIRFSTLEANCRELVCQPGDISEYISKVRTTHSPRRKTRTYGTGK